MCVQIINKFHKLGLIYFPIFTTKYDFKKRLGYSLNLDKPETFNEKIQWLKFNYRDPIMTKCADKAAVRDLVKDWIGEKYLIPIYGIYDSVDDINLNDLPKSFVLKPTHTSGKVIICEDKDEMNWCLEFEKLKTWLKENYYFQNGEWVYRDIKPKIICEKLLGNNINDYKVFCFNGKAKFIHIDFDRKFNHTRTFYNREWKNMYFTSLYPLSTLECERPTNLELLLSLSEKLAERFPFVRTDFYIIGGEIFFGELTFFHGNGMEKFSPKMWDKKLGNLLNLNMVKSDQNS